MLLCETCCYSKWVHQVTRHSHAHGRVIQFTYPCADLIVVFPTLTQSRLLYLEDTNYTHNFWENKCHKFGAARICLWSTRMLKGPRRKTHGVRPAAVEMLMCREGAVSYIANMKLAVGQFPIEQHTRWWKFHWQGLIHSIFCEDFCYKMWPKQIAKVQFRGLSLGFYLLWSCEF